MRYVQLDELTGEEVLAKTILDANGKVLLAKGIRTKQSYVDKLRELGVSGVYIEDSISEGIIIEDILCEETRIHAKDIIKNEVQNFIRNKAIQVEEIRKVIDMIIKDVLSSKSDIINLKDLRIKDDYTFSHSVNVCLLSVFLAIKMGFDIKKVHSIGTGCILHDIGKILIPSEIIEKPTNLTPEEFEEVKKHPFYGYKAIKDDQQISPTTKAVVLLHHERLDGSGYPNGFTGEKIQDAVRICAICDVFDAMTSDRVYRNALSVSQAVEYLYCTSGILFDKNFVTEFLKYIPIYAPGTVVLLNNGIIAIVIENNSVNLIRPVVRYLYNPRTKVKYGKDKIIDMMDSSNLTYKIEREIKLDRDMI